MKYVCDQIMYALMGTLNRLPVTKAEKMYTPLFPPPYKYRGPVNGHGLGW